jgi:hypothetical protein
MVQDCTDCQKLWSEYAAAIWESVRLQGKLRVAELQHDTERITTLTVETATAMNRRQHAREAIRQHDASIHNQHQDIG